MFLRNIMFYIAIIIGIHVATVCYADVQNLSPDIANIVPQIALIEPSAIRCNASSTTSENSATSTKNQNFGLRFRLPFMDVEIQNQRNVRLLQESQKRMLFVLHGNELFQMFVSREEKHLSLIGLLDGSVRDNEHLGAEIISWHNYLLLVVALEEHLEIYQISEHSITARAEIAKNSTSSNDLVPNFQPIQQLTLPGRYRKIYLAEPIEDKIMLIVAVNYTKLYGRLKTYEWLNTYFDPVAELTVPPIHVLSLVGDKKKYLISGRTVKYKSKTILTTYEIELPTMKLKFQQTLTVDSRNVHTLTYRGQNYIIACSTDQKKCNTLKMHEGQFRVYRQRTSKELAFSRFIGGDNFLVGARQNEIVVFTNARLECYAAFSSNETDVSSIISHVNEHGEDFILVNYMRPFQTLVRVVEIEDESGESLGTMALNRVDVEEINLQHQHEHIFEDTIGTLRSLLLKRRESMDVFRKISNYISPKLKSIKIKNAVNLKAGNIGIVKIVGKTLRSPVQLLNRIRDLAKRYSSSRVKRGLNEAQNRTQPMAKRLRAQFLKVGHLIYNGNIIEGFYLDSSAKPLPILSVRPAVRTKILHTPELLARPHFRGIRQPYQQLADFKIRTIRTRRLNVKRINDIPWTEFYDTIFLKNRDTSLEGRLILQAETRVHNLWTSLLNGLVVDNLFNLVQPQVVQSNIVIAGFFATELDADVVNGLDFAKDIVFRGEDNFIETPVKMHHASISGDLLLADNSKMERVSSADKAEFQQMYTGKVILNGSLTVNNLLREDTAKVIVDEIEFSEEVLKRNYMLNNTNQEFAHPITFGHARVDSPSLQTNYLNDQPPEQHLLRTTGQMANFDTPLFIIFMRANITDNLICDSYSSSVANLSRNAVRHGEVANITGTKIFQSALSVDHLMTLDLNNMPISELVLRSQLRNGLKLKGNKNFQALHVQNDAHVEGALKTQHLNSLSLSELLNYDYHLDNLTLAHNLHSANIVFHKINGISFDKVFTNFKVKNDNLVLHKDLIIEGSAQFTEQLEVDLVNNIDWTAYQQSLVRIHENAEINGHKHFLKELVITNELNTPTLNNLNMPAIFANILSQSKPQTITGTYSFDDLSVTNLDVTVINDVPTSEFIDKRTADILIESDIVIPKLSVKGNVAGHFVNQLDLKELGHHLQALPRKQWRNIHVLGNAKWNLSSGLAGGGGGAQDIKLAYLHKNAVRSTGNQIISGNVKLRRPLISKMITKLAFPKEVDFDYIARDCLLKNTTAEQVITGTKNFLKPLNMQSQISVAGLVGCNQLNNFDILRLNASLYRLTSGEAILGPLNFHSPLLIGQLTVQGNINGIKSNVIYHLPNTPLPALKLKQLFVHSSLQIQNINDMSLDYLLKNRVTKNGEALEVFGFLTFEHLVLDKEILLQSINGIPIDSLVVKTSNNLQAITGNKTIEGDLILAGPAHVMRLNDKDLIEAYQKTVFKHQNYNFDSLVIDQATFESGLIVGNDMAAPTISLAQQRPQLRQKIKQRERLNAITRELNVIDSIISAENSLATKKHLVYLDYNLNVQALWQTANETIDKTYSFETKRLSICERQMLHVQKSKTSARLYLRNTTSSVITANLNDLSVKVENYCKTKYRKVRSKITITSAMSSKVFGMKKFIENVAIFMPSSNKSYILLHAIDIAGKRNEIRLLKIENNLYDDVLDAQSITLGIGRVMRLFDFSQNYSMLASAALINNYPAVSIYIYSQAIEEFKLAQVIDGDYDIIELIPLGAQRYHLLLSCVGCSRISIYEYNASANRTAAYHIFQFVKLNQLIDKLVPFTLSDGSRYLLVLSEHDQDYYHLYKLSHIQGWLHVTYGYFHNIQLALPMVDKHQEVADDNLLLLLCGNNQCRPVNAFIQQ